MDYKRELNALLKSRSEHVEAAKNFYAAGETEKSENALNEAKSLNPKIDSIRALIEEAERYAGEEKALGGAETNDKYAERGNALLKGGEAKFDVDELRAAIKSTTIANTTLAKPTAVGGIQEGFSGVISSLIDQVRVVDLSSVGAIYEAYEISDMEAQGGAVSTLAGTARTASDPTFAYAKIAPYEVNVTSYVDRNLNRLTPIAYEERIRSMAMRAMRRKVNGLILNGDGQASPDMYGVKTARNAAGAAIFDTVVASAIDVDLLDKIVFAYGGDEQLGGNARLFLSKADLKAIGALRGTNEKKRLFTVTPDAGNPNTGVISDGGLNIPYTILDACTSLSAQGETDYSVQTMCYGDPANYELGLFGAMTVRVDESYKAAERMNTILGDAMTGGNLIVHKGMIVVTTPAKA